MIQPPERRDAVPVTLDNGKIIKIEVNALGREDVTFDAIPLKQVTETIESVVEAISDTLVRVGASRATITFGIDFSVESGALLATLVKGTSQASLEISLEWSKEQGLH